MCEKDDGCDCPEGYGPVEVDGVLSKCQECKDTLCVFCFDSTEICDYCLTPYGADQNGKCVKCNQ